MTNRSLIIINGTLLAGVAIAGFSFLVSTSPAPKEDRVAGAPFQERKGEATSSATRSVDEMAPSEKALSNAELERQNRIEAAARGADASTTADAAEPARLPLVLLKPGPEMGLDAAAEAVVQELREAFADDVKQSGYSPSSPEYLNHWVESQRAVDEMLRAHLGEDTFLKFSVLAMRATDAEFAAGK